MPILCLACIAFFASYQNQWVIMSESIAKTKGWTGRHRRAYAGIYFAASLIAIEACVPLYQSRGMLPLYPVSFVFIV